MTDNSSSTDSAGAQQHALAIAKFCRDFAMGRSDTRLPPNDALGWLEDVADPPTGASSPVADPAPSLSGADWIPPTIVTNEMLDAGLLAYSPRVAPYEALKMAFIAMVAASPATTPPMTPAGKADSRGSDEITKSGIVLEWGKNQRNGREHEELHAPCGCAFHERPAPHWHPCRLHAEARCLLQEALDYVREWPTGLDTEASEQRGGARDVMERRLIASLATQSTMTPAAPADSQTTHETKEPQMEPCELHDMTDGKCVHCGKTGAEIDAAKYPPPRPDGYVPNPGAEPTAGGGRFFIDHGVIHDRKTGTHRHWRDSVNAERLQEECDALNAMEACAGGVSERYLAAISMDDKEALSAPAVAAEPVAWAYPMPDGDYIVSRHRLAGTVGSRPLIYGDAAAPPKGPQPDVPPER